MGFYSRTIAREVAPSGDSRRFEVVVIRTPSERDSVTQGDELHELRVKLALLPWPASEAADATLKESLDPEFQIEEARDLLESLGESYGEAFLVETIADGTKVWLRALNGDSILLGTDSQEDMEVMSSWTVLRRLGCCHLDDETWTDGLIEELTRNEA